MNWRSSHSLRFYSIKGGWFVFFKLSIAVFVFLLNLMYMAFNQILTGEFVENLDVDP